jgi:hypothetical protein
MTPDIVRAEYVRGHKLKLFFDDGKEGVVDFQPFVQKGGVFDSLADMGVFKAFSVNPEVGVLEWPGNIDIAPEVLYCAATGAPLPAWMNDSAALRNHSLPQGRNAL